MKGKLYARELLKKLLSVKDLEVLEIVWDEDLSLEQKIKALVEE